ncbi:MAG: hypothetical protein ABL967_07255 [Bryobacteraceae bacterium]
MLLPSSSLPDLYRIAVDAFRSQSESDYACHTGRFVTSPSVSVNKLQYVELIVLMGIL